MEKLAKNSRTSGFPNRITLRHPTARLPQYLHPLPGKPNDMIATDYRLVEKGVEIHITMLIYGIWQGFSRRIHHPAASVPNR